MLQHYFHRERGDVAIYMSLMIMFIMLSSALVFSFILVRQIRATEDVLESERSLYAANSGLEHMQYVLTKGWTDAFSTTEVTREDTLRYTGGERAAYTVRGKYDSGNGSSCVQADGAFRNEKRRLQVGLPECLE